MNLRSCEFNLNVFIYKLSIVFLAMRKVTLMNYDKGIFFNHLYLSSFIWQSTDAT